jgi:hypothetical protein
MPEADSSNLSNVPSLPMADPQVVESKDNPTGFNDGDTLVLPIREQLKLYDCSRGEHAAIWYKFKRFETLALLNLYHYQHELVKLEDEITHQHDTSEMMVQPGVMTNNERRKLRELLQEYCQWHLRPYFYFFYSLRL